MEERSIIWEAEVYGTEKHMSGVLLYDLKAFLQTGIRKAISDVRDIFKLDVVPQLGTVSNLDEVMKQQVPKAVRKLQSGST
jgi:hypothetical protein